MTVESWVCWHPADSVTTNHLFSNWSHRGFVPTTVKNSHLADPTHATPSHHTPQSAFKHQTRKLQPRENVKEVERVMEMIKMGFSASLDEFKTRRSTSSTMEKEGKSTHNSSTSTGRKMNASVKMAGSD